jgi:hypothetical protein
MQLSPVVARLVVSLALPAAAVSAETTNCAEIAAIPYTIIAPGVYCLKKNLQGSFGSGSAIEILAAYAVLDLNGFRVYNTAGPGNSALGIHVADRESVVIRNGIVKGFSTGVFVEETAASGTSRGNIVEDMIVDRNYNIGVAVMGRANTVRRCQALAMGIISNTPSGINADGSAHVVADNTAGDFIAPGGYGVFVTGNDSMVVGNRVTGVDHGMELSATTKYRDNIVTDSPTPYSGGIDIGNNN